MYKIKLLILMLRKYLFLYIFLAQDGAEPCGNSVSAHNLIRLDHYLNREDFRSKASKIFKGFSSMLNEHPIALPEMTSALMLFYNQPYQVYI